MKIKFALTLTDKVEKFKKIFDDIESASKSFLLDKFYGEDLFEVYIGWICVAPDFDEFYKIRKPKYILNKETIVGDLKYVQTKALEIENKLDYLSLINSNESNAYNLISQELLHCLVLTITGNKKIKDFNLSMFKSDFHDFLVKKSYINSDVLTGISRMPEDALPEYLDEVKETIDQNIKSIEVTKLLNLIASDFMEIRTHEGLDIHYQEAIKVGLDRFDQSGLILDSVDEEDICNKIEDLMDMVGLQSSGGHLNNWRYGFDPTA